MISAFDLNMGTYFRSLNEPSRFSLPKTNQHNSEIVEVQFAPFTVFVEQIVWIWGAFGG